MSIIYDALKKSENNPVKNTPSGLGWNKRTIFVSIIFIITLIFGWFHFFKKPSPGEKNKSAKPHGSRSEKHVDSKTTKPAERETPVVKKTYPRNTYTLEGIIYDGEIPLVIINGTVLKTNDKIDNMEVLEITPSSTTLINPNDNSTQELKL